MSESKYVKENLLPMLRKAAQLRNEMISGSFTDNGGAIHSAERILDLLSYRICYPGLKHVKNVRGHKYAHFSKAAWEAYSRGKKVNVEHVAPIREFTRLVIRKIDQRLSDDAIVKFIRKEYRLCLLTPEEMARLNRNNRSQLAKDRLSDAGIETFVPRK